MKPMNLRTTLNILKYIAESPKARYGGFDSRSIQIAQSAIYHIKTLRRKAKEVHHETKNTKA